MASRSRERSPDDRWGARVKEGDPSFAAGSTVGGYRIEHLLGEGGMGAVYAAVEPTIGRRVAIKVLRRELVSDKNHTLRFEREARSVSSLRHPTIVDIFSFGKLDDGRPFFVMPLLTGRSLREHLARHGKLAPHSAWQIAREIAAGLSAAHAGGVLHRDLKPDNVFLAEYAGRAPQPMLLDFGLAKRIDAGADEIDPKDEMKLTATGVPLGTPLYMAPEQWWSAPSSPATDQYAFGVVLFEMLAGRPPFNAPQFAQLLQQHLHEKPPSLSEVDCAVSAEVEAVVARLLSKDATDRYADFDAVIEAGDAAFGSAGAPLAVHEITRDRASGSGSGSATESAVRAPRVVISPPSLNVQGTAPTELLPSAVVSNSGQNRTARFGYAVTLVLGFAALWAVGYAGSIRWDVRQWFLSIGWGAPLMLVATIAASIALPKLGALARTRPGFGPVALAAALAPAALSVPSLLTGWGVVTSSAEKIDPGQSFVIMHVGFYEVALSTFVGQGVSAVLCLGLIVLLGAPSLALSSPWLWASAGSLVAAALTLAMGVPSPALLLLPASGALLLLATWTKTPTSLSRERALAAISAVLCARGAAESRADAFAATAWFETTTRADRIALVVRAATEKRLTLLAGVFAILLVVAAGVTVFLRAKRAGLLVGETARSRLWFGVLQAGLALMVLLPASFCERDLASRKRELNRILSEQYVLYSRLDPPSYADGALAAPVGAPALQITLETIALNGKGIGKLSALDTETGRQAIATAIVAGLAAHTSIDTKNPHAAPPRRIDLALIVDRRVQWKRVEQVLALAFDGGARDADVLLTRGREPNIPADAPLEASHLVPTDFVALPLALGKAGLTPAADSEFADVASSLLAQPGVGERSIAIAVNGHNAAR